MPPPSDPFAAYQTPTDPFVAYGQPLGSGATPETALQEAHPDVGFLDRFKVMFRGGDQAVGQRFLESRGFEAKALGGAQYALRKPGESAWRLLDKPGAELQDISDVAGDVLSLGGMIGGGVLGSAGGIAGAAGGAALGSAGATGLRQLLSGLPATTEETVGELGEAALTGATAEFGGQALGGIARGLRGLSRAGRLGGARAEHLARSGRKMGEGLWRKESLRGEGGKFRQGYKYIRPETPAAARMAGRIGGVGERLRAPQEALAGFAGSMGGRLVRSPVAAAGGFALGGPFGTALGISGVMGAAGKGLGKVSRALMSDTSGRPLLFLLNRAGRKLGGKIERALQYAGNPQTRMVYRASIFQLLQDPDFRALVRGEMGGSGR